jgi:hypothetical protein
VNTLNEWPDESEERQLLSELRAGIPTAKETVTVRFLPLLAHFLRGVHRHVDTELCDTAAADAVFDFVRAPERYDCEHLCLGAYLKMAAKRDLLNLLDKEGRARRGISLDSVAEPADRRNDSRNDDLTWDHPRLAAERAAFDRDEEVTFVLMLEGVRDTAAFAQGLRIEHLPAPEQVAQVKRMKDRVKKRLARAVEDLR